MLEEEAKLFAEIRSKFFGRHRRYSMLVWNKKFGLVTKCHLIILKVCIIFVFMAAPSFYNTLYGINYRLLNVTYIVAVGIYAIVLVVKWGSNHDIAVFKLIFFKLAIQNVRPCVLLNKKIDT